MGPERERAERGQEPPPEDPPLTGAGYPRRLRMVRAADFQRAYRQGSRARGDVLVVVAVENGLPHPRLGLSVGRSTWKRAVRRNRVRRIFREAFRLSRRELPPGFDLVLLPAAPRLEPELAATRAELVRLARKAAARQREKSARTGGGTAPPPDLQSPRAAGRPGPPEADSARPAAEREP